jgi:tungstate transport system substrate-binding protein
MSTLHRSLCLLCVALIAGSSFAAPAANTLRLATTTTTEDSGLLKHLLPQFEKASGIKVQVITGGTGKALQLGMAGDVDAVLVHSRADEDRFIAAGHGNVRKDVMYNDFVFVGPKADPASIRGLHDPVAALQAIRQSKQLFVSRGDDSGTHKMELQFWQLAGAAPDVAKDRSWYLSTGSGMAQTLRIADQKRGYALTDRATFIAQRKRLQLQLLMDGKPKIANRYGIMDVVPSKNNKINHATALRFIEWITGPAGQAAIRSFKIDNEQVFFTAEK